MILAGVYRDSGYFYDSFSREVHLASDLEQKSPLRYADFEVLRLHTDGKGGVENGARVPVMEWANIQHVA